MAKLYDLFFAAFIGAVVGVIVTLALTPPIPKVYPTPTQVCSYLAVRFDNDAPSADSWDPTKRIYRERDCPDIMRKAYESE